MYIKSIGTDQFSKARHSAQSPSAIIAARRAAGNPLRITLHRGPETVRCMRERSADLRLAAGALNRDPSPPWDRELSLALDRWVESREVRS